MAIYQTLPDNEKEFFDEFAAAQGKDRQRILEMMPSDQKHLYENIYNRIDRGDKSIYPGSKLQLDEQYLSQKFYDLKPYFEDKALPEGDWVGWHENAQLDDVKVRYVNDLGMDLYDADMYNSKLRAQARRSYLDNSQAPLMRGAMVPGAGAIRNAMRGLVNFENQGQAEITHINAFQFGSQTRGQFEINDDRRYEMIRMMQNAYE